MKRQFKKLISAALLFAGFTLIWFSGCGGNNPPVPDNDLKGIYENHNISACGINDPLKNIEWLNAYCKNLDETKDFPNVIIYLYKIKGTDEHLFKIVITFFPYTSPTNISEWRNCNGEIIGRISPESWPGVEEEFMKDKELVAELFHYLIPVCGVYDPVKNIKWLKEYCESVKENQDISSVSIKLYKVMDSGEYIFQITILSSSSGYSTFWRNCAGEPASPQSYEGHITSIFYFVKQ